MRTIEVSTALPTVKRTTNSRPRIKCEDAVRYLAVYKIYFIVTLFFLFMSLIMIGVRKTFKVLLCFLLHLLPDLVCCVLPVGSQL